MSTSKTRALPGSRLEDYPRPSVTVDCIIFAIEGAELQVLLTRRPIEPFRGAWTIPGGFIRMEETLEDAARRVLKAKTGLSRAWLEQLYTFGEPKRDPRGRVVTVAYYSLIRKPGDAPASLDGSEVVWMPAVKPPKLGFDHARLLEVAVARLRSKIRYEPIGFELLPRKFVLTDLQRLYEGILARELDKRNFRKKILSMGILRELDEKQTGVAHRAARYHEFDRERYEALRAKGFLFEL